MRIKYILGVKLNLDIDYTYVLTFIRNCLKQDLRGAICTTNPEFIVYSQSNNDFKHAINTSLLSTADGTGVVLADIYSEVYKSSKITHSMLRHIYTVINMFLSIILGKYRINTVTGVGLLDKVCAQAEKEGHSVMFLGGWPRSFLGTPLKGDYDIAGTCALNMLKTYPKLKVVAATSKFNASVSDDLPTLAFIKQALSESEIESIDILFVSYGSPNQELWYIRNKDKLPVKLCIGVGGAFDYLAEVSPKPWVLFRALHLEWLFRLLTQPYRYKRIFTALVTFPIMFLYKTYYTVD